ncbi:MAG: hypothetical protein NTY84_08495, partial [Verrucomicrobia bacterium]|nr:hypothetical protein [Verrucomicrobiota bacterium]
HVNRATHEHKEDIKIGYNLRRKVVLMALWAVAPVALYFSPNFLGLLKEEVVRGGYLKSLGLIWLYIGLGGLIFRTVHLFFLRDVTTGLVWALKIMTDPFHDILLYWRSPLALLRGELIDPMDHTQPTH